MAEQEPQPTEQAPDLREALKYRRSERKDKFAQNLIFVFSVAFWGSLVWAILDYRSFSKFFSFLGF